MSLTRRSLLLTVGTVLSAGFAGCATDDGSSETTATTTADGSITTTATTSDDTPTNSTDDRPEWVRATESSISVRDDLALDDRENVADYDLDAGTVELVIARDDDGEVDRSRTVDIEEYAYRSVGHSLAAETVCERLFDRVSITPTGEGPGTPECSLSSRDDRRIVSVTFVPEDHDVTVETLADALPETVTVTIDSEGGEFTFDYPVFVEVTEPFVLE